MKKIFLILLLVLLFLTASALILPKFNWFWQNVVFNNVNKNTDFQVAASDVDFNYLNPSTFTDLKIDNNDLSISLNKGVLDHSLFALVKNFFDADQIKLDKLKVKLKNFGEAKQDQYVALSSDLKTNLDFDLESYQGKGEIIINDHSDFEQFTEGNAFKDTKVFIDINNQQQVVELDLRDSFEELADVDVSGNFINSESIKAKLGSDFIKLDNILAKLKKSEQSETKVREEETENSSSICETKMPLESLSLDINLNNLSYEPINIEKFLAQLELKSGVLKLDNQELLINKLATDLDFKFDLNQCFLDANLDIPGFPLEVLLAIFKMAEPNINHGSIDELSLKLSANPEQLIKTANGKLLLEAQDVWLPSKIQDIVPFNILFLPFKVILKALETIGAAILPGELGEVIGNMSNSLSESGRLEIEEAKIDISFKDQIAKIHQFKIVPNLLPTILLEGEVKADKSIDLVATIKILTLNLRVPVGGTLDAPRPNVVRLVPEIIKGLALSIPGIS